MAEDDLRPDDFLSKLNSSFDAMLGKVGKAISDNFDPTVIADTILKLDEAAIGVAKSFGQGRENVLQIKAAMADAYTSVVGIGGTLETIQQVQNGVSSSLGRNFILASESYEKLFAVSGVTGQGVEKIVTGFKDAGFSVNQAGTQMEKVVNQARALGVSVEAVSGKVLQNMSALNKFNFEGGVQGLARMAAQATSLRIDMGKTLSLADELFNPDKAIELAASMQRLGVANTELLDPLRLMDLAQNDPAELQNQIVKMTEQFVQMGKDGNFEIAPGAKRQLREIAKETGIAYEELSKMAIGSKELDDKLTKIRFPDTFTEDQKTMIANMAEMGENGEFQITVDGKGMDLGKALAEAQNNPDFFKSLEEASKPKKMEEIAFEQLGILGEINANIATLNRNPMGIARGKTANQALEGAVMPTKLLKDFFDTQSLSIKNLGEGFDKGAQDILGSLTKLASGEGSLTELMVKITEGGQKLNDFAQGAFVESADKYKQSLDKLSESNNMFFKLSEEVFKSLGKSATDFIQGKDQNYNTINTPQVVPQTVNSTVPNTQNLQGPSSQSSTPIKTESTVTANVNLNINSTNPNIDPNQLAIALQSTDLKETIVTVVKNGMSNNGLTGNPNNVQAMRNQAEMSGNLT